jgi:hypothetical protein
MVKSGRAPKKNLVTRREELEADEWMLKVELKRVLCKGCNKWKEFQKPYEKKEWEKHKQLCSGISGKAKVRIWNSKPSSTKPVSFRIYSDLLTSPI